MTTLAEIRTEARQRADMENSDFIQDAELTTFVNKAYAKLYNLLVKKFEDYFVEDPVEFSISSGSTYDLPSDFFKLIGLDKALSGTEYYTLRPFVFEDRNRRRIADRLRGLYPQVRYRIIGKKLHFVPDDQATGDYRMWYVPAFSSVKLSADTDTIDTEITNSGWEDYIVVDTARRMLLKEESDVTMLMAELQKMESDIEEEAQNRDAGESDRITDVTLSGYDDPLFTG